MSPRAYSLGRRAEQMARTRDRILAAAIEAYRDNGIRGTSMQEVARRADVAPGTVLNHFPTPAALTEAALARITESLDPPSPAVLSGTAAPRKSP